MCNNRYWSSTLWKIRIRVFLRRRWQNGVIFGRWTFSFLVRSAGTVHSVPRSAIPAFIVSVRILVICVILKGVSYEYYTYYEYGRYFAIAASANYFRSCGCTSQYLRHRFSTEASICFIFVFSEAPLCNPDKSDWWTHIYKQLLKYYYYDNQTLLWVWRHDAPV